MWPFKKNEAPAQPSRKQQLVAEMRAWREVGETFTYLGRVCVVTGYATLLPHRLGINVCVELLADYSDDHGVIRSVAFSPVEWRAIAEQQPPPEPRGAAQGYSSGHLPGAAECVR